MHKPENANHDNSTVKIQNVTMGFIMFFFSKKGSICTAEVLLQHYNLTKSFTVCSDDVAFALKGSKELPWLAKYL